MSTARVRCALLCLCLVTLASCAEDKALECADGVLLADGRCVAANSSEICGECPDEKPMCNTKRKACVACLSNRDCVSPEASVCDPALFSCVPCLADEGCAHLGGTPVCEDRLCRQCAGRNESACGIRVCDVKKFSCSQTQTVASRQTCETCLSDRACQPDYRCVPMMYRNTTREQAYCLRPVGIHPVYKTSYCHPEKDNDLLRVYTTTTTERRSLSGAPAESYCGIREELTTCEAIEQMTLRINNSCNLDSCYAPGASCKNVFVANQTGFASGYYLNCTYRCIHDHECKSGGFTIGKAICEASEDGNESVLYCASKPSSIPVPLPPGFPRAWNN